jgi:hypothetical protein
VCARLRFEVVGCLGWKLSRLEAKLLDKAADTVPRSGGNLKLFLKNIFTLNRGLPAIVGSYLVYLVMQKFFSFLGIDIRYMILRQ